QRLGSQAKDEDDRPATSAQAMGRALWSGFAHPSLYVRWRSAHALRALTESGKLGVLNSVVQESQSRGAKHYREPNLSFYWLSGLTWTMLSLARVADEQPLAVRPHVQAIARIALDADLPHVLIRSFAARAALRAADGTELLSADLR